MENYLTIDFEEWYQGLTSTSGQHDRWPELESRIQGQTDWLLEALDQAGTKATFFVVGELARTNPEILQEIHQRGHEIGLHGDLHKQVSKMSRGEFRDDLMRNIEAVSKACDHTPLGYRAAYASLSEETGWVWDELASAGIKYDSSVFPIKTPLYGMPGAPRFAYPVETPSGEIMEYPISTIRFAGKNWPMSGGFYFRALPYAIVSKSVKILNRQGHAAVMYFHPWEFDPDHPMPDCVSRRERLSHYGFLKNNQAKFERLLKEHNFTPMKEALIQGGTAPGA